MFRIGQAARSCREKGMSGLRGLETEIWIKRKRATIGKIRKMVCSELHQKRHASSLPLPFAIASETSVEQGWQRTETGAEQKLEPCKEPVQSGSWCSTEDRYWIGAGAEWKPMRYGTGTTKSSQESDQEK